ARNAAKNVSDHASSASIGPRTARHTRSTVGPYVVTISSKGGRVVVIPLVNAPAAPNVRSSLSNPSAEADGGERAGGRLEEAKYRMRCRFYPPPCGLGNIQARAPDDRGGRLPVHRSAS